MFPDYLSVSYDYANTKYISEWKSKGVSDERIKPLNTSDNSLISNKIRLKFNGGCLKRLKLTCSHGRTVSIYIVYELGASSLLNNDVTLKKNSCSLFGAVRLFKKADTVTYLGYGIGFDRKSSFSFPFGGFGQNVINFGVHISSSIHTDNKKGHFISWKRSNTRVRTCADCTKNVFN